MDGFIDALVSAGAEMVLVVWQPLWIWTLAAALLLLIAPLLRTFHSQYSYHLRLGLLLALPAGLLMAFLLQGAAALMSSGIEDGASFKLILVQAPVAMSLTPGGGTESGLLSGWFDTLIRPGFYASPVALLLLSVSLFAGLWFASDLWRLNRFRRRLPLIPLDRVHGVSSENCELAGGRVLAGFNNRFEIPMTFGWRNPVVLLPASLKGDDEQMNLVLRHELMHIRLGDYPAHLAATSIRMLFWFHPLVHLLCRQLGRYREMRCDSFVLNDRSISRKRYATLLLDLLAASRKRRRMSALPLARRGSALRERLLAIQSIAVRERPVRSSSLLFGFIGLFLSGSMAVTEMVRPDRPQLARTMVELEPLFGTFSLADAAPTANLRNQQAAPLLNSRESISVIPLTETENLSQQAPASMATAGPIAADEPAASIEQASIEQDDSPVQPTNEIIAVGEGDPRAEPVQPEEFTEPVNPVVQALQRVSEDTRAQMVAFEDASVLSGSEESARQQTGSTLTGSQAAAQRDALQPPEPEGGQDYFVIAESMPVVIGGMEAVQEKVVYPEMARRAGIEGRVFVQFIVTEDGGVENPRVIQGIGGGADQAALRAVQELEFRPGMQRGYPVRVQYALPVIFRLQHTTLN
ncbi:MAG: M56 family metallopeptidase [Balneolaceae bacterium]